MAFVATVRAQADFEASRRLRKRIPESRKKLWRAVARDMNRIQAKAFRSQSEPRGRRWRALTDATIALRRRGGLFGKGRKTNSRRILEVTGKLRRSARWVGMATGVRGSITGRARRYGPVHLLGNPRNRLPNRSGGHPAPIPARRFWPIEVRGGRPVIGLSKIDRRRMTEAVGRAATGQFQSLTVGLRG